MDKAQPAGILARIQYFKVLNTLCITVYLEPCI